MAKGPGGKSVGRVSIRVLPDTTRFRADLKKALDRIEKVTKLVIKPDIDQDHLVRSAVEARDKAREVLQDVDLKVRASASREGLHEAKKDIHDSLDGQEAKVDVDVSLLGASAHLSTFLRERFLLVSVKVRAASLAAARTAMMRLSGARVLGDYGRQLTDFAANFDRIAPKIAMTTFAIGNLASVALSSVSGLLGMVSALGNIVSLASVAPAALAGAAISAGILVVAWKDAGTQLASLKGPLQQIQHSISGAYWGEARKAILDLANSALPALGRGLTSTARELGSWTASVADSFRKAFSNSDFDTMFSRLNEGINNSKRGTDDFAGSIRALGMFGSQFLPSIGDWFSTISGKFNDFIQTSINSGQMWDWVKMGVEFMKELGSIGKNAIGIVVDLGKAAEIAGSGGLSSLDTALSQIRKVTDTPTFQLALSQLFKGAGDAVYGLGAALKPINKMLGDLAPTLGSALGGLGKIAGSLLSGIAEALDQPAIQQGIDGLVGGISDAVEGLKPALKPLGDLLGSIADLAGTVAGSLGGLLGEAIAQVAPYVSELARELQPLLPEIAKQMKPVLAELGPFMREVVPALVDLVKLAIPLLGIAVSALVAAMKILGPVLGIIGDIADSLAEGFTALQKRVLGPFLQFFGDFGKSIADWAKSSMDAFVGNMHQFADILNSGLDGILQGDDRFAALGDAFTNLGQSIADGLGFGDAFSVARGTIQDFFTWALGALGAFMSAAFAPIGQLSGFFTNATSGATTQATAIISGFGGWLSGWMGSVVSTTFGWVGQIGGAISGGFNGILQFVRSVGGSIGGALASAGWGMVSSAGNFVGQIVSRFQNLGSGMWGAVGNAVNAAASLPGQVLNAIGNVGGMLYSSGQSLIGGFINGIRSMMGRVGSAVSGILGFIGLHFPNSPAKIGPFSGAGWTRVGNSGAAIIAELTRGARSEAASFGSVMADLQQMVQVPGLPRSSAVGAYASAYGARSVVVNQTNNLPTVVDPVVAFRQAGREVERAVQTL